jgi:hypothetical protein
MGMVQTWNPPHERKMEERLNQRKDRAVHVINGGSQEEQEADKPSNVSFFRSGRGEARAREAGGLDRHCSADSR